MKEKGMDEFLYAAKAMKEEDPSVNFEIVGNYEEDYKADMEQYEKAGIIAQIAIMEPIQTM